MPFGYFGTKNALARFYPMPKYDTVIEPFAGAAGYASYWARQGKVKRVILIDQSPRLVALWHRYQRMSEQDLRNIPFPIKGERTTEYFIASASGEQGAAVLKGSSRQITDRMVIQWPGRLQRLIDTLPFVKKWDVSVGDYSSCLDIEATWFIDPPYHLQTGTSGRGQTAGGFRYKDSGGEAIFSGSYKDLAEWCKARQGQVIVCEQEPADWLPFVPFRRQRNGVGAGTGSTRTEVVWTNA